MTPDVFMRRYERATGAHDLEGTLALIAEEAVYLFSDGSTHIGKAEIRTVLSHNFEAIRNETYTLNAMQWLACSANIAVCVYEFAWTGEIEGKSAAGGGRRTSVLHPAEEGWLVVHEHLSAGRFRREGQEKL